jgi:hypothetical protein
MRLQAMKPWNVLITDCIHMGFPELWGEGEDIVNREPYDVVSPDLVVWYSSTSSFTMQVPTESSLPLLSTPLFQSKGYEAASYETLKSR